MNTYFTTPSQIILKINTACFLTAYVTEETKTTTVPPDSPTWKPTDDREVFPTDDYSQPDLDPGTICRISAENCGSIKFLLYLIPSSSLYFFLKKDDDYWKVDDPEPTLPVIGGKGKEEDDYWDPTCECTVHLTVCFITGKIL